MNLEQFVGLLVVYLVSLLFVMMLTYQEFCKIRFNFNVFFSLLYLLTFYLGFPFTCLLIFYYSVEVVMVENLLAAMIAATAFYGIYYVSYKSRLFHRPCSTRRLWISINRTEFHLLWLLLTLIAVGTTMVFFIHNGFLLFQLRAYNQIFSSDVADVALKRFFYFFIPAMLLIYFLHPTRRNWLWFLIVTVTFGIFTYIVVGGTRANIIIAFAPFLFIGIQRGWITLWILASASVMAIAGMFWLALKRYGLNVSGDEAFYTFLYLTRDTFSPWENLALLLQNYSHISFQGLAPIVRDFYVFIPSWLWPERPLLMLNTANYFTWAVLDNHSGLAMSPTLIGSMIIMGGVSFIPLGAIVVGLTIKLFDTLYECGKMAGNRYRASLLQAFCFGAVFSMTVLACEGLDAFVSRVIFFCLIFGLCLMLAKLLCLLFRHTGLIRTRAVKLKGYVSCCNQLIIK